jgi:cobalamin biosynthesis protein CobC
MREHFARTRPPGTDLDTCNAPLGVAAGTVSVNEMGHAHRSQRELAKDGELQHGGKLRQAAARYGIPIQDWLDLSTGINPNGWPVPPLPPSAWSRLPEDEDGLEAAARSYYGTDQLLPVAGSQAAIQALPRLRLASRVGVLYPGYAEHAYAWRCAGHELAAVPVAGLREAARHVDVLVVINPNNPTGDRFRPQTLLDWHASLAAREGWLVVDQAFIDPTPADSLVPYSKRPGLIVLRSLGKFFGLAGARVGFVLAQTALLERLHAHLGPWTVTGPSRWVAERALADRAWQGAARARLLREAERLAALSRQYGLTPGGGCALFQWISTAQAAAIHERLARQGVLTRLFLEPASLRFGLPGAQIDWARLAQALGNACREAPTA